MDFWAISNAKWGKSTRVFFCKYRKMYFMKISDNLTLLTEDTLCSTMHNSKFR